jgi:hypothetical protein
VPFSVTRKSSIAHQNNCMSEYVFRNLIGLRAQYLPNQNEGSRCSGASAAAASYVNPFIPFLPSNRWGVPPRS